MTPKPTKGITISDTSSTQAAMSKGCVEPDSSDESLGRIIYAFTWWLVHIGLVRMIANAPTHPPAPEIRSKESASPESISTESTSTKSAPTESSATESASTESASTESAPTESAPTESAPTESTSTKSAPTESSATESASTELMQSETCQSTATAIRSSPEPTSTPEANIPLRPQRVIVRPDNVFKMAGVDADPNAVFTTTEQKILESFEENLRNQRLELSSKLGFTLPTCHASLVSVTSRRTFVQVVTGGSDATGRTKTFIRITGLRDWRQISSFHDVLTMKKYRGLYEPLDLCYHKDQVRRMALEASCAIRDPAQTLTLCGCTIIIQTPGQDQRTSTLGGLLTVRGKFYALTTSHMPDDDDGLPEDTVDYESDDDRGSLFFFDKNDDSEDESSSSLTPFEFNDGTGEKGKTAVQFPKTASLDVNIGKRESATTEESASGFSPEEKESRTAGVGVSPMKSGVAATTHIITKSSSQKKGFLNLIEGDNLKSGDDWLLVPVGTNLLFPNRLPAGVEKPATWQNHFIESFCPDLGKLFVDENDPNKPPTQRTVWAIAGMGGLIRSSLCPSPSFILSNGCEKSSKVWMVEAEAPSQGFQAGDSGSWIVDDRTRRVLGILVARVGGVGYMTSFASIRQDIISTLRLKQKSIQLASRMDPLIRGRGGGQVLRSDSQFRPQLRQASLGQVPIEQALVEQAPDTRSWGQRLSDSTAATLEVVRHPVDLGFNKGVAVLGTAMVYVIALSNVQGPWESWNSLQLALALPGCVLLFWVSSELRSGQQEPQNRPSQDVLVWRRRVFWTWLWISLAAGILVGCGNQILRPTIPEDTRSWDEKTRDWDENWEDLKDINVSASLSVFQNDMEDLRRAWQDGDVLAILSKLMDMFLRRLPRFKRS